MKLKDIYDRELKLPIYEILLGLNLENSSLSHCIDTVIIWRKWYVNKNKGLRKPVLINDSFENNQIQIRNSRKNIQ